MTSITTPGRRFFGSLVLGLASCLTVAMAGSTLASTTVTFKNSGTYTGTDSTSLFPGDTNGNYGSDPYLHLGYPTGDRRALIRFDVSALSGQYSQITSITLNMYVHAVYGNDTLSAYQVASGDASWVQGTGNGTVSPGAATEHYLAYNTTTWAGSDGLGTPGTDYINTVLASAPYTASTPLNSALSLSFTGSPAALTTLINTWLTPGQNGGLLLRDGDLAEIDPYSSAAYNIVNNPAFTPELIVTYSGVPEPATLGLVALGSLVVLRRRRDTSR